jgi:hypothetical protein
VWVGLINKVSKPGELGHGVNLSEWTRYHNAVGV